MPNVYDDQNRRVGVVLIVKNAAGNFLVLKQADKDSYSFISGGQEPGETLVQTAIREAYEEAGLIIEENKLIATTEFIEFEGITKGKAIQYLYLYNFEGGEVKVDNNEIVEYYWSTPEDVLEKLKDKQPLVELFSKAIKKDLVNLL